MAKGKTGGKPSWIEEKSIIPTHRARPASKWQKSYGMFITGQSFIDQVTLIADEMECKWGVGRLRMAVGPELRDKFDRQRYLFNQAITFGELEDVRVQSERMAKAWKVLDKAADALGAVPKSPDVWDVISDHGNVYAIARNNDEAKAYAALKGTARVYSIEEICKVLDAQSLVNVAKEHFQEAEIVDYQVRAVGDVLDDVFDTAGGLDDRLDDEIPF